MGQRRSPAPRGTAVTVAAADPAARPIEDIFAEAMAGPHKPREVPSPPDVDHDAPFGRDEAGVPLAPHGTTRDGRPKLSPAGRKPRDARVAPAPQDTPPAPGTQAGPDASLAAGLTEFAQGAWFCLSAIGSAGPQLPLIGRMIPGDKLGAQAAVFHVHSPRLVAALTLAAEHSDQARRLARRLASGDATWAILAGMMVLPFVSQSAAVWRGGGTAGLPPVAELATANAKEVEAYMAQLAGQVDEAREQAAAQMAAATAAESEAAA